MNSDAELKHLIYLRSELYNFEEYHPMSPSELMRIRNWVYQGNCVYSNPWHYAYISGWEMNYLDAIRFHEDPNLFF